MIQNGYIRATTSGGLAFVAFVAAAGSSSGATTAPTAAAGPTHIGFAHAKDTLLFPERIRARGVFDVRHPVDPATAPWTFAAVGRGHADETWAALIEALRRAGHDGDLSIEHEDPTLDAPAGLEHSLATLRRVLREG